MLNFFFPFNPFLLAFLFFRWIYKILPMSFWLFVLLTRVIWSILMLIFGLLQQHISCTGQLPNKTYHISIRGLSTFPSTLLSTPPFWSTLVAGIKVACYKFLFSKIHSWIMHPVVALTIYLNIKQIKRYISRRSQMQLQPVTPPVVQLLV